MIIMKKKKKGKSSKLEFWTLPTFFFDVIPPPPFFPSFFLPFPRERFKRDVTPLSYFYSRVKTHAALPIATVSFASRGTHRAKRNWANRAIEGDDRFVDNGHVRVFARTMSQTRDKLQPRACLRARSTTHVKLFSRHDSRRGKLFAPFPERPRHDYFRPPS